MSTTETHTPTTERLLARIDALENRLGVVEDTAEIERLQFQYGYYLDKCYYDEVVELFADSGARMHFLHGVFEGKEGVARLISGRFKNRFADGVNGPSHGRLLEHPQMQPVITIAGDRQTAKGRFRTFMQAGTHISLPDPRQWWEGGIYENSYVRENGQWKIQELNFRQVFQADFSTGWMNSDLPAPFYKTTYPEDPFGPDDIRPTWQMFPSADAVPFHYPHPVTGSEVN